MRWRFFGILSLIMFALLSGCVSVNLTQPLMGKYVTAVTAAKDYKVVGIISVTSTETHTGSGSSSKIEGGKITYYDLMKEAARLGADDIIDVRIEKNIGGNKSARIFTYTGSAAAIKYVNKAEETEEEPELVIFNR